VHPGCSSSSEVEVVLTAACPHCAEPLPEPLPRFCPTCGCPPGGGAAREAARETRAAPELGAPWRTTWRALFTPTRFFLALPLRGGLGAPSRYVLLLTLVAATVATLLQEVLLVLFGGDHPDGFQVVLGSRLQRLLLLAAAPVLTWLAILLQAAVAYLVLRVGRDSGPTFEATFRVFAYAQSAGVFGAVPWCGTIAAAVYGLVLQTLGLTAALGVKPARAVAAVLLSVSTCTCVVLPCVVLPFGVFVGFLGGLAGGAP
jgi:hypothetical protein